jgi:uncharacterized protein
MEMNIAVAVIATTMFALAAESVVASDDLTGDCRIGTYQLQDHTDVDIGATEGPHLRWRRRDGTTGKLTKESDGSWTSTIGWTQRSDGKSVSFSDCASGEINFDGVKGKRIAFDVTETKFQGAGVSLAGRLVMPKGTDRVPIVVLIHGSEHDSAREFNALQRQFPAEGIGAFVYDKRGTGASTGRYTQDYLLLADDAIAAVHEAKRLSGSRAGRIGYQGPSQGGWVAPLAAKIEPVDFVIVGFGLAVSPLDEDREAIALDVTRHGYGADVMAKAMEVADATAAIILSDFCEGYDRLDAVRARYANEPWFKYIHGDITFALLQMSEDQLRKRGPELLPHVPAQYDPMPVLRNLDVPQLWILAADDTDAPSAETERRLRALAAEGKPIVTTVFPHTDHGIYEYETKPDGTRMSTRHPDGYFAMMLDFIRSGHVGKSYGTSLIFHSSRDQK